MNDLLYVAWRKILRRICAVFGVSIIFDERELHWWFSNMDERHRGEIREAIDSAAAQAMDNLRPGDCEYKNLRAIRCWLRESTEPHVLVLATKSYYESVRACSPVMGTRTHFKA